MDTVVRESTCFYGLDYIKEWTATKNNGFLVFIGNQMGPLFAPLYRSNLALYHSLATLAFQKNALLLDHEEIAMFLATKLNEIDGKIVDLFALNSSLYLNALIYVFFGKEVLLLLIIPKIDLKVCHGAWR